MQRAEDIARLAKREALIKSEGTSAARWGDACPLPNQTLMWEYECDTCRIKFETIVPHGPKEEREIRCPQCKGKNIHRLNVGNLAGTACAG